MLSPRETLLLPANRAFIAFTLALAFLLGCLGVATGLLLLWRSL